MPDFDELRADYWRKTYRTEILTYETGQLPNGAPDHSNLLKILQELQPKGAVRAGSASIQLKSPTADRMLRLARLAASIVRQRATSVSEPLPLTVSVENHEESRDQYFQYSGSNLMTFLRSMVESLALFGLPGAGKTFTLRRYAAELATALLDQCVGEENLSEDAHVPIFANLALYSGDLRQLLQGTLPTGLELAALINESRCTVILDAANEVPREFIDNGRWLADLLDLISVARNCRFIIGSRPESWLSSLALPRFSISDIESEYVIDHFSSRAPLDLAANPELLKTLSKPLFFMLATNNQIRLDEIRTPADVYQNFFDRIAERWGTESGKPTDFASALKEIAFGMLENGAEYAAKELFYQAISSHRTDVDTESVISFLLSQGVLVALTGQRLSFFHQTVTEYLAAKVIALEFVQDNGSLVRRLQDKRWDHALFLAMSFLNKRMRDAFLTQIVTADLAAAARAVHYVEDGQVDIINDILLHACNAKFDFSATFSLAAQLSRLPYTFANVTSLKKLCRISNVLGGLATGILFRLLDSEHKTIIDGVLQRGKDHNYVANFVHESKRSWTSEDLDYLFHKLCDLKKRREPLDQFGSVVREDISEAKLAKWCEEGCYIKSAARYVLIDALEKLDARFARSTLTTLVRIREPEAFYSLYTNLKWHNERPDSGEMPADQEIAEIVAKGMTSRHGNWTKELASALVKSNPDWIGAFSKIRAENQSERLLIQLVLANEPIATLIKSVIKAPDEYTNYCLDIVGHLDFWSAAPLELVMDALITRNPFLAGPILSELQGKQLPFSQSKSLNWWLSWAEECVGSKNRNVWWCGYMLSRGLGSADNATRKVILEKINTESDDEFERIGRLVFSLGSTPLLSTDELSSKSLDRLLNEGNKFSFSGVALGLTATEEFASAVLVPHLNAHPTYSWIAKALAEAGRRHNRRYVVQETHRREHR